MRLIWFYIDFWNYGCMVIIKQPERDVMIEYKQPAIVAELRRRIQEGIYTSLLPTTAELAAEFGVNVKTMGKAIARLVAEGRLER